MCVVMAEMIHMPAITSRSLIHNLNDIKRLEKDYFDRLGQSQTKTIKVCGHELNSLALHYKKFVASRRVGIDEMTCKEIENYFNNIATAMNNLLECIQDQPMEIYHIYNSYEHGHTSWSLSGSKRSSDINNIIMQLWHDGNASSWFLPQKHAALDIGNESASARSVHGNRIDELVHLANLMRRLSNIYQRLKNKHHSLEGNKIILYDEKDALIINLAELLKKKARPVLHVVDIATSIHEWATGDPNPQQALFTAAYKKWKNRP